MKKILFSLIAVALLGCTNQATKPLTDAEKAAIIKEVTELNQSSIDAFNKVDFTAWKSYFLNSPDFRAGSIDGLILNYEQFINDTKSFFESASSMNFIKLSEYNNVLERDLVINTFQIKTDVTMKTGEKLAFEKLMITSILKKIDNQWGAIFYLESGLPPVVTKSSE